jgi:hypothetical protein
MTDRIFFGLGIAALVFASPAESQEHSAGAEWYRVGPLTQVYVSEVDKFARLADFSTLSRKGNTVTVTLYVYSGNDPIVPLGPLPARFERERVKYDCGTLRRETLSADSLDWTAKDWRKKAFKYPGNLPHEPDQSPDRQIARLLCKSLSGTSGPSYSTLGHAIRALDMRFGRASR